MALRPVASSWQQEIADVASDFMNGSIEVVDPGEPGEYDPVTDEESEGTPDVVYVSARPARIQHLGSPSAANAGSEFTSKVNYLFQYIPQDGDKIPHKGLVLRVLDGGLRPELEDFAWQIIAAPRSSHDALITVRASTDMAEVSSG